MVPKSAVAETKGQFLKVKAAPGSPVLSCGQVSDPGREEMAAGLLRTTY